MYDQCTGGRPSALWRTPRHRGTVLAVDCGWWVWSVCLGRVVDRLKAGLSMAWPPAGSEVRAAGSVSSLYCCAATPHAQLIPRPMGVTMRRYDCQRAIPPRGSQSLDPGWMPQADSLAGSQPSRLLSPCSSRWDGTAPEAVGAGSASELTLGLYAACTPHQPHSDRLDPITSHPPPAPSCSPHTPGNICLIRSVCTHACCTRRASGPCRAPALPRHAAPCISDTSGR